MTSFYFQAPGRLLHRPGEYTRYMRECAGSAVRRGGSGGSGRGNDVRLRNADLNERIHFSLNASEYAGVRDDLIVDGDELVSEFHLGLEDFDSGSLLGVLDLELGLFLEVDVSGRKSVV